MNSQRSLIAHVALLALCIAATVSALGRPLQAQGQAAPSLRLVSTVWPPFTNAAGEARFALDLVAEALKRIGVTAETVFVEDPNFTSALLTGQYDGSAAAWKDAERERVLLFSEPYLENRLILVGRRGSDVTATTLAALAGKRIVVVGGYSYGDAVKSGTGPTFILSRSEEDSLSRLLAGDADYTLMDELVVQYLVRNYAQQARDRLQVGATPLIRRSLHFAVRRDRPDAISVINRFNSELRRMVADRTYHRLLHVDWLRADVDGDGRPELISRSDQAGLAPPTTTYDLFLSTPAKPTEPAPSGPRFYLGGNIYEGWASVPKNYKVPESNWNDADRSTASIFRFTW
jgi:polar amino acid transport system substrate-binding protein